MRHFTGYLIVLLLLPLLFFLLKWTSVEANQSESFDQFLNHHIQLTQKLEQNSFILDQKGNMIDELVGDQSRIYRPLSEIPLFTKQIFIQSEDKRFYEHQGFDLQSISRAFSINVKEKGVSQGASTITQQTARNLYLNQERSYNRKLSELLYAYQMERKLSKEQILELYLNVIYFQNGAYGIEAASRFYFNKPISKLAQAEQAFLAAIPNNPTLYDPLTHFDFTKKRQERLIDQLVDDGLLIENEAELLKKTPIRLNVNKHIHSYPDYTNYVKAEFTDLIAEMDGFNAQLSLAKGDETRKIEEKLKKKVEQVLSSGIVVHTSLDPAIQQRAKIAIKRHLPYNGIEGAVTVVRNEDLAIIALIGGKDYQNDNFNRAYQAYRQPGSAIKPLLVYAPYLNQPNKAATDSISGAAFCKQGYCPENYGGASYGNVSIEKAFIYSYNTPAIRVLDQIGVETGFSYLNKFKFQKVSNEDHRLAAAIGGFTYGMSPLELTSAYATFAHEGNYKRPRAIRKVTDSTGKTIYQWKDPSIKIWEKDTIQKMRDLLNKTVTSGTAKKARIHADYVGGKTGTTNEYKDFWFVGLTDQMTAAVWVGKDTPANIQSIEKSAPQLLIWRDIMRK